MDSSNISSLGTTTANIKGVNLPLFAMPIKTNAMNIGNSYDARNTVFFKLKDDPRHKRKKKKKRKKFEDRIEDIERNYMNDMRNNSYLMSYGPGAIGF
jgi:hypothetical protein